MLLFLLFIAAATEMFIGQSVLADGLFFYWVLLFYFFTEFSLSVIDFTWVYWLFPSRMDFAQVVPL